jgi:DNA-binding MarR family transcriptional regulator
MDSTACLSFRIPLILHIVSSVNDVCEEAVAAGAGLAGTASALLAAIGAVRRTARRAVQQAWDQEPLPPARSELLLLVARRPGITVAEAAHELHLAQNTVSTLVSKLAAEQLLDRGTDTADRRAVRLTVAPAGRARLAGYRDLRAELAGRALAGLTAADQEALAAAVPALHRLAGQLEAR